MPGVSLDEARDRSAAPRDEYLVACLYPVEQGAEFVLGLEGADFMLGRDAHGGFVQFTALLS